MAQSQIVKWIGNVSPGYQGGELELEMKEEVRERWGD